MRLTMLVGPPGSGKSTLALKIFQTEDTINIINQDSQGKDEHLRLFKETLDFKQNIVVDRMNFSKEQRERYLKPAKEAGYETKIVILHENFETCLERMKNRVDHPTIKDEKTAKKVLNFFYSKYERVEDSEADEVVRIWPEGEKPKAIICDLDGTLCDISERLHYVRGSKKKDWKNFFEHLKNDKVNYWCRDILNTMYNKYKVILCSGRSDEYRGLTDQWLTANVVLHHDLYMRYRNDFRQDNIVKEMLLDFEILTRYTPYYVIDDRKQVVDMWRKRGITCLQCAEGDF